MAVSSIRVRWPIRYFPRHRCRPLNFLGSRVIRPSIFPFFRSCSNEVDLDNREHETISFDDFIQRRRNEAKRSVLLQINDREAAKTLSSSYRSQLKQIYFYRLPSTKDDKIPSSFHDFLLMEFVSDESLKNFMKQVSFPKKKDCMPVHSHFVQYKKSDKIKDNAGSREDNAWTECNPPNYIDLLHKLRTAKDVSVQMTMLHKDLNISDLQYRLRFIITTQLEAFLSGLFPNNIVYPFGSSVNGFGQTNCDLDMVILFNRDFFFVNPTSQISTDHNLQFQAQSSGTNGRSMMQKNLEIIGDMLNVFVPGCLNVRRILKARVPIVKFSHAYTGLECDLSTSNISAVRMSELLYLLGEHENRLRVLFATVYRWARAANITHTSPGPWITSFQLTMMVIFYLQQLKKPLLPSLKTLMSQSQNSNFADETSEIYLKDVTEFQYGNNNIALTDLLHGFFHFYESFDFTTSGISVLNGNKNKKIEGIALYIENPVEKELNVSQNVAHTEVRKLHQAVRNALWALETQRSDSMWGILRLLQTQPAQATSFKVHELFTSVQEARKSESKKPTAIDSLLTSMEVKYSPQLNRKNSAIKKRKNFNRGNNHNIWNSNW